MDCLNHGCPFRENQTSNANRCEHIACQNRYTDDALIVFQINQTDIFPVEVKKLVYDCGYIAFDDEEIGKSVFLTREAAEAALKGENNG